MITLVEGAIGSGKTYYVVSEILRKHFTWSDVDVLYKQTDENVLIYTNIDNFLYGEDLVLLIEKYGGIEKLFTKDVQRELASLKKIVYVIDECQEYFDRKFYNKPVFNLFQSSRRIGIDVYLITQDVYSVAREIHTLAEHHVKVVRRSYSFFGEFRYHFMSGNEVFKRKVLKPDKKIFAQYRSSLSGSDSHKPKKFAFKFFVYVGLLLLAIPFGGYGFVWLLAGDAYFKRVDTRPTSDLDRAVSPLLPAQSFVPVRLVAKVGNLGYFVDSEGSLVRKQIVRKK